MTGGSAGREIVLVDCPDEVGLIHRITGVLQALRLNIDTNHEYVDAAEGWFFFRAEVTPAAGPVAAADLERFLVAALPAGATVRVTREAVRRIVVCATREPHCLGELLLLAACGDLPVRIEAVVANHDCLRSLVERFDVPFHHVSHEGVSRGDHEALLLEAIGRHAPEYVVLARYMRVLSEGAIGHYADRIVNIHHSFLPAFAGASPYKQAHERGVKLIGATCHYVTADLDAGPIIEQEVERVSHFHSPADLARLGRQCERIALAKGIRYHVHDRTLIDGHRAIVFPD